MNRLALLWLAVYLLSAQDNPALTREERWRADIRYLLTQLSERHAKLDHTVGREELERDARRIEETISSRSDAQLVAEIARLVARIGDGHTGYFIPWDRRNGFRKYPLELWMAPEGPLVLGASRELGHLAGAVITRFGKSPSANVEKAIEPLLSRDNAYGVAGMMPAYMVLPEVLHALGLIDDMERLPIEAHDACGRRVTAILRPVAAGVEPEIVTAEGPGRRPLWLRNREDPYWFEWLAGEKTLYVQYNDASFEKEKESFADFCRRLQTVAESEELARLVLDLRWNDGGSLSRTRRLLHSLIRLGDELPEGKLFVIIGRMTFSAAALFAVEVEQHTSALFVGEPSAGRPNGYGELRRFRLPHSGLEIRYSAWRYQLSSPGDTRPAIMPDLTAVLSAADYRSGVDPAMEAIRAYRPRTPIREAIRKVLDERGVAAAIDDYRRLEKERFNSYVFAEPELEALGRDLLREGKMGPALALFSLNAEKHPWSAQAEASLGDALAQAGRCEEARRHAERAFVLDRSYLTPAERLARAERCR